MDLMTSKFSLQVKMFSYFLRSMLLNSLVFSAKSFLEVREAPEVLEKVLDLQRFEVAEVISEVLILRHYNN